jgi:uncharacterized protein YecE (DUF72 family)
VHPITIGTCGWSYADWKGAFYPDGMAPGSFLWYYAERYSIVEVDSTFYRSPSSKMVEGWADKTPDEFRFSLKVPQTITHEKLLSDCGKETEVFLDAARLLGPKLLCCVLQFGYFNKSAFAGLSEFLERLEPYIAAWPADVTLGVEIRNKTWLTEEFANCLRRHRAVWVLSDQEWMPSPLSLVHKFDVVTGPFAYLRLLGNRAEVDAKTKELNRVVVDRTDQIHADALAAKLLGQRVPVLVFVQ